MTTKPANQMNMREAIAAQCMAAMLHPVHWQTAKKIGPESICEYIARFARYSADALIAELGKTAEPEQADSASDVSPCKYCRERARFHWDRDLKCSPPRGGHYAGTRFEP